MKKPTLLLAPALAVAALAAMASQPSASAPLPHAEASSAAPEVPWLVHAAHAGDVHTHDPHAGLYHDDDPHAGLHDPSDPHAALHDPHAALHDPHAALHGAHDPHDPHDAWQTAADLHGARAPSAPPTVAPVERSRAANGRTVAEIFEQRAALNGKRVSLRATVVKATDGVLGKTYLHLQDGSGSPERETHDLTATTTEVIELGETLEVEGVLAIDHDVGLDYRYPALLADVKRVR